MSRSMTAFARQTCQAAWGNLVWEVRTVNHRYLELHFRLPDTLRDLETTVREKVRQHLNRGKVELALRFAPAEVSDNGITVNLALAKSLNDAIHQVNRLLDNPAHVNALDVLRWPGVLEADATDLDDIKKAALALCDDAIKDIVSQREREGQHLTPLIEQRLDAIDGIVAEVKTRMPDILQKQSDLIRERFEEARVELDTTRLEQEMVMLAQKTDVAEELDRLHTHVKEVRRVLKQKGAVGRKLDFLMQELNREANTLGSKSIVTSTTQSAVELKVLIEQMREQIQNIE